MNILTISLGIALAFFAGAYTFTLIKLRKLQSNVTSLLYAQLSLQSQLSSEDADIHKENFIKFLSESRDWAFEYIESVQSGLKDFIDAVEKDIKYFDKYGEVGSSYPHYDSMTRISSAYKELKTLLPEDSDDRR